MENSGSFREWYIGEILIFLNTETVSCIGRKAISHRDYKLSKEFIYIKDGEIYRHYNSSKAGRILKNGYFMISIGPRVNKKKAKRFPEHKVVWIYYNGDIPDRFEIDHINRDRLDNRIENLRCVQKHVNLSNNNAKNYSYDKKNDRWMCSIVRNGISYKHIVKTENEAKLWVEETKGSLDR